MASDTELILRWFYREVFPSGILEFDDLLAHAVVSALERSRMDAEAYVYKNSKRHWNDFLEKTEHDKQLGRSPLFLIQDRDSRRLKWIPSNVGLGPSLKEKSRTLRLGARPHITRMIDLLSDRQYEALGCVVSRLAGATEIRLTPRGNEGGIDFFALINTPARCHIFHGDYRPLRIVGQSKKYKDKVQVDRVKEFIETLDEVKRQSPEIEHLVPPWFRTTSGPVVGWLIAHSGAQGGAMTKARNHGIIISDTIDLAEISALSRQIDISSSAEERAKILHSWVLELLKMESS